MIRSRCSYCLHLVESECSSWQQAKHYCSISGPNDPERKKAVLYLQEKRALDLDRAAIELAERASSARREADAALAALAAAKEGT